jgi:hypothetical protein
MEAGGFEPPSRDISGRASTCLVVLLRFRAGGGQTTGFRHCYFAIDFASASRTPAATIPLFDAHDQPAGGGQSGRAALRQPWRNCIRQVNLSVGFLTRPTDVLDMQPDRLPVRSKPFAPIFTF